MPKLTPTFHDNPIVHFENNEPIHVVEAHEPLPDEDKSFKPEDIVPTEYDSEDMRVFPGKHALAANNVAFEIEEAKKTLVIPSSGAVVPELNPVMPNQYVKPAIGAKKVAVLGTAPSSRMLAPYNDPSWQIWSCSPGNMGILPRFDRWFEIHITLHRPENAHYGRPYLNWLKTLKCPVYAQQLYANPMGELPNAISYPKEEMVKEFGPYFFTSSFAWMIALAIYEGAEEIALFGVDMASRDEYILQRPGGYYFLTECKRRGIRIGAPYESDILQPPPLYGFCDSTPFMAKVLARERELRERIVGMKRQVQEHQQSITYLEGALEDLDYIKNIWGGAQENTHG